MLHLAAPTRPDWIDEALSDLDTILLDHAHCEKKAASTAVSLIFRTQDRPGFMAPLSALAREELEHFERMLDVLQAHDVAFRPLAPSPYARRLREVVQPGSLVDLLLCCALIEARSCERMKILAEVLPDAGLRAFYTDLLACEARHHTAYVDLACEVAPKHGVLARLSELAIHEAEVLARPSPEVRLHS